MPESNVSINCYMPMGTYMVCTNQTRWSNFLVFTAPVNDMKYHQQH